MHKFSSHPLTFGNDVFSIVLSDSMALVREPVRASGGQVKLNDSQGHGAKHNMQHADCLLAVGG